MLLSRSALLSCLLVLLAPQGVAAQACPSGKYCFYVPPGLPLEASHSTPASRRFDIVLSSPVRTVSATYAIAGGTATPITISPGTSERLALDANNGPASSYLVAEQRGIFIVADSPNLTVDHRETFDQEQYSETIKQSAIALGTRFRLGGYALNLENRPLAGVDAVMLYAPTGATITLSAPPNATLPLWSGSDGPTITATLKAGQTYAVRTVVGRDLDGALLEASAPVAASTGGRGWAQDGCGDDGMDGLVPSSALGTEHAVRMPSGSSTVGDESHVRVIADVDGTDVRVNGTLVATLAAGSFYEFAGSALSYVQTSRPALVWMNGSLRGCELDTVLIPPIAFAPALTELSLDFNVLASDQVPSAELAVLITASQVGSIRLDGAPPTFLSEERVPGRPDLTYARFDVTPGDHNVRAGADFQALLASRTQPSGLLAYYNPYRIPGCGDGAIDAGEQCDDANVSDGDGCSQSCTIEPGYGCDGAPSVCATRCGDGRVSAPNETCDDGNTAAGDGCNVSCRREVILVEPAEGTSLRSSTPRVTGTADPGAAITLGLGDQVGATVADADGAWTWSPSASVADGAQMVLVTATDVRGGVSMATRSVRLDTATFVTITEPSSGSVIMSAAPTFRGASEAYARVDVLIDGASVGSAIAQPDGTWQLVAPSPLAETMHTLVATATDAFGNTATTTAVTFAVDLGTQLTITAPVQGATLATATPDILGTSEPGARVEVSIDGTPVGTSVVDGQGGFTVHVATALDNGTHTATARARDVAGNTTSATVDFRVDVRTKPFLLIHNLPDGAFTSEATPLFSGAADPAAKVLVTFDGVLIDTVTATYRGAWSLRLIAPMTEGPHTLHAETTDALGRRAIDEHTFVFDPGTTAIAITFPRPGSVTQSAMPTIRGTSAPNARVEVIVDGEPIGSATAGSDGMWHFDVPKPLRDGHHGVRANGSSTAPRAGSAEIGFYVDTKTYVAIRTPGEGMQVGSATPTIVGAGEPNDVVDVAIDGANVGEADVAIDGSWTLVTTHPLSPGAHTVRVHALDPLGNEASDEHRFTYEPSVGDADGDGVPDREECDSSPCADSDGDGLPNDRDDDDDGDGLPTAIECTTKPCIDHDQDGLPDYLDGDDDGDGRPTSEEHAPSGVPRDSDSDGLPDQLDTDDDGDGLPTHAECTVAPCPDSDGDGAPDWLDPEDDNDGVPTAREHADGGGDADGDGQLDWLDPDANGNGADDGTDGTGDSDGNGVPNYLDPKLSVSLDPATAEDLGITVAGGGGCAMTGGDGSGAFLLLALLRLRRRRKSA